MDPKINGTSDILSIIPKYMALPIRGFKNPNYHCFVTTDHFMDLIKNGTLIDNSIYALGVVSTGINLLNAGKHIDEFKEVGPTPRMIWRLWKNFEVAAQTLKRLGYILSIHFYGLQPEYGGIGLTEFKDNKINSFVSSDFHTVLNPYEYILFNHPVHAASDGVVSEIVNSYPDKPRYNTEIKMNLVADATGRKVQDYMGNKIVISHTANNGLTVNTVYANIKKDSFLVRVGEPVKKGQIICKVGCSGTFRSPMLYFGIMSPGFKLPFVSSLKIPFHATSGIWMPFYVSNLLDIANEFGKKSDDFMRHIDSHKIKYELGGSTIRDCSFIRQTATILAE